MGVSFLRNWHFDKILAILDEIFDLEKQELLAGNTAEEVWKPLVDRFVNRLRFDLVELWSVDPRRECLVLVAKSENAKRNLSKHVVSPLPICTSMTGEAVDTRMPVMFTREELEKGRLQRRFVNQELLESLRPRSMFCIPVLNIGNPHQVLFVFNFYTKLPIARILEPSALHLLSRPAERMAIVMESNLRERTIRVSNDLAQSLANTNVRLSKQSASRILAETIRRRLNTDFVAVYLHANNELVMHGHSAKINSSQPVAERAIPRWVRDAFGSNREFISQDDDLQYNTAVVPLLDVRGNCSGVIESVISESYRSGAWLGAHTYDDVALIEAMSQTFAPTLEVLSADQRRDDSLLTTSHELRVPVVALRAVIERLESECNFQSVRFQFPYFNEIQTYTEIMQRLMKKSEILRYGTDLTDIRLDFTNLLVEVINPAIRFMRPVLLKSRFKRHQLVHSGFDSLRRVRIDKALVTQIVFNIIENAIKYYPLDAERELFSCTVTADLFRNEELVIRFCDNGGGIAEEETDRIFEYGFRGKKAVVDQVEGTGFGLYYSREIAKKHSGSLILEQARNPTIFKLAIPCPKLLR